VTDAVLAQLAAVLAEAIAPAVADELERRGYVARSDAPPFLSVEKAATFLAAKPQRVYDLLSSGRLQKFKDGARVLVSRAELEAYVGAAPAQLPRATENGASRHSAA
jgi:excisionase family DNA binding protein